MPSRLCQEDQGQTLQCAALRHLQILKALLCMTHCYACTPVFQHLVITTHHSKATTSGPCLQPRLARTSFFSAVAANTHFQIQQQAMTITAVPGVYVGRLRPWRSSELTGPLL